MGHIPPKSASPCWATLRKPHGSFLPPVASVRKEGHSEKIFLAAGLAAAVFAPALANATVYRFSFESFDAELMATGEMAVNTAGDVTGVSGMISGLANETISAVTPNP